MRLFCLPLAVLLNYLPSSCALDAQVPLANAPPPPPIVQSTTLIEALGNGNYTRLLRLLQHARLVPTLNRLNGSTLFAPTDDAIQHHPLWSAASDTNAALLLDNVQEELRQQLLYHLLNYSVPIALPTDAVQVHKTLLFPRPPSQSPPPWVPTPEGTLGGEPQRVRWAPRDGGSWIGTDDAGNGGVKIVRDPENAGNGILIGVDGVLDPPSDLADVVEQQPSLAYFHKILPESLKETLKNATELTLFVPRDEAWDELHPVEKLYLESNFSDADVREILDMHAVVERRVRWSDTFTDANKLTTVHGNQLTLHVSSNTTNVSSASLVQPDIYASNGVLHIVSSLLIPPGELQLTPEKYLLALNCTSFVSMLRSVSLSSLVNTTNASYTILAPRDDVLALLGDSTLPERGSHELAQLLRYHFLPGQWTDRKLRDGMLVETALEEKGLNGGRQVLGIGVTGKEPNRELTFGGAAVIGGKPLIINDTIIYLITRALIPPTDALETALPSLQFSTFLASVFSASLAEKLKTSPNTTLLIPQNYAFERLGLVTTHLLLASSKPDLEKVIQHHAVAEVVYLDELYNGLRKTYPTLEGSDLHVERSDNGSVYVSPSGGWYGLWGRLGDVGNILTRTGVIHEVSSVLLPRNVHISIGKLAMAAKGTTMVSLAVKVGMEWVLNGTAPPDGSEWAEAGLKGEGWTLLCPTDESFKGVNMTRLWADVEGMRRLVLQHLIPPRVTGGAGGDMGRTLGESEDPNRPIYLDESATYATLLSRESLYGDVVFRHIDHKNPKLGYLVGIKDARGTDGHDDWANVLSWGRSTTGADGGGVVQIDNLLVPYLPAWWVEYGPGVGVVLGGVFVMAAFFGAARYVWRRETGEATYEPVGGFDREDDDV